jgi:GT2 family glycosyltransferase
MKKAGWKVYHVPQAEVIHFQGKSAEQDKKRAKVEYDRSRYLFFRKHRGILQWFILVAGRMLRLLIELMYWTVICSLTFFTRQRWKKRLARVAYLLEWHLKGCPKGMGLKGKK